MVRYQRFLQFLVAPQGTRTSAHGGASSWEENKLDTIIGIAHNNLLGEIELPFLYYNTKNTLQS